MATWFLIGFVAITSPIWLPLAIWVVFWGIVGICLAFVKSEKDL